MKCVEVDMLDQMDLGWKSWKVKWGKVVAAVGTAHTRAKRPSGLYARLDSSCKIERRNSPT